MKGISHQSNVTLIGAGPGDPDLLTIKAMKAIQAADTIIFDNLVSEPIRALFPSTATLIFVGKQKGCHSASQDDINQILLEQAKIGGRICRVKGGDSFVFGRGGEEMLWLSQHGVDVEVIPGITAASGCTTYSQIPLTHRGLAQGCTFITAHAERDLEVHWDALAKLNQTLVIYMGLTKTQLISASLIEAGMDSNTPVALIEKGCCPDQRTLIGTLDELDTLKQRHSVQSPALIVIGQVVTVAEKMQWLAQRSMSPVLDEPAVETELRRLKLTA
ncbi:uroporphyrinogen-III C-methyltransferase [Vibrio methylphosphonaticus]|uniref:uroporphyrinogen-III C-methyltransferase n=1 Tax=Vibrio methylphosphonaticus TaxID=2946866 RepID=UPI00202A7DD0|nr:uroporphyrinogen-III C-methyltransferase [Vibrio methylphosphonaticus]MCL9774638.1 uroporphyrinogen-III C-methyltransferase [Vibrio methylphosphonaticus]